MRGVRRGGGGGPGQPGGGRRGGPSTPAPPSSPPPADPPDASESRGEGGIGYPTNRWRSRADAMYGVVSAGKEYQMPPPSPDGEELKPPF